MNRDCTCKKASGVTIIPMGNQRVGIIGLEEIFNKWYTQEKTPSLLEEDEMIQAIKKRNYMCNNMEKEYANAIRIAYSRYYGKKRIE
ncbi:MAG: hypothetical protein HXS47_04875 [Theionarchaea archaeon]|nr:hypothetical protein [Theionarchaea archaeon]